MARNSLQDKFQTSYPYKEEDDEGKTWEWAKDGAIKARQASGGKSANSYAHQWQDPAFVRTTTQIPYVNRKASDNGVPVWTDMQEVTMHMNGGMSLTTMSETDVTNVVKPNELLNGFCLHDMDSVDDEYTGANSDHFYGIAKGPDDGGNEVEGFVERNNYLDRLAIAFLSLSMIPLLLSFGSISWTSLT
jgi:hypothetical protein